MEGGIGTKSRFLGLSERFGDYILQSKLIVDDIWRIYSGFSGSIWLKRRFFDQFCGHFMSFLFMG